MFVWWWFIWIAFLLFIAFAWFNSSGGPAGYRMRRGYYYDEPWSYGGGSYGGWAGGPYRARSTWPWRRRPARHSGKGPAGYHRSDARIAEDVNDALMVSDDVDAAGVSVSVNGGVVTLSGYTSTRAEKRLAEDLAEFVPGVTDVKNELRIGATPPQGQAQRLEQTPQS
jgi:hypothetical protein